MKDQDIQEVLTANGKTAPRVTEADIIEAIVGHTFTTMPSGKAVICEITLQNGYTVRGESAVVSKENFVEEIGQKIAYGKARDQIWQLEGYLLQQRVHEQAEQDALVAELAGDNDCGDACKI